MQCRVSALHRILECVLVHTLRPSALAGQTLQVTKENIRGTIMFRIAAQCLLDTNWRKGTIILYLAKFNGIAEQYQRPELLTLEASLLPNVFKLLTLLQVGKYKIED